MKKHIDPVYHCIIYKLHGCSHVDGFLCEFNTCVERLSLQSEIDLFNNRIKKINKINKIRCLK